MVLNVQKHNKMLPKASLACLEVISCVPVGIRGDSAEMHEKTCYFCFEMRLLENETKSKPKSKKVLHYIEVITRNVV